MNLLGNQIVDFTTPITEANVRSQGPPRFLRKLGLI
jgi:hypothetical protein